MCSALSKNYAYESIPVCRKLKQEWQEWEASLLVNSSVTHSIVNVFIPKTGARCQTFIYGFDLNRSELLLENLYPFQEDIIQDFHEGVPPEIWLQLKASDAYYNILVAVNEIDGSFLTTQVLEAGLTRNRRWEDRVYFPSKNAPKVEIQFPQKPVQSAQLSNLSVGGAQVILFGMEAKHALGRERFIRCRLKFSQDFIFDFEAELKQCQFLRSPCCHSVLRLQFSRATPSQRAQLASLIAAFRPKSTS